MMNTFLCIYIIVYSICLDDAPQGEFGAVTDIFIGSFIYLFYYITLRVSIEGFKITIIIIHDTKCYLITNTKLNIICE